MTRGADMGTKEQRRKIKLSQGKVDKLVIAQANNDSGWEKPVRVKKVRGRKMRLQDLLRKVTRANLHGEVSIRPLVGREAW